MNIHDLVIGACYKIKYNHGRKDRSFRHNDSVKFIYLTDIDWDCQNLSYDLVDRRYRFVERGRGTFKADDISHQVRSGSVAVNSGSATPKKRNIMKKLSAVARKILDKDYRTLVKGGVLSDDLSINDSTELLEMLVMTNKVELAKIVEARLAEEKKDRENC